MTSPKPVKTALDEVVASFVADLADILATSTMDDVVASPGDVMDASSLAQLAADMVHEALRLQLEGQTSSPAQAPPSEVTPEPSPVPSAKPKVKPTAKPSPVPTAKPKVQTAPKPSPKPRPPVVPTVIPPVEPRKPRRKPAPEPEVKQTSLDPDAPRKTKLRKKSEAGKYKTTREETVRPTAKVKKWPRCTIKGCEKSVYAPSGHRQLCYEHHLSGGGSRPPVNKK